MNALTEMLDPMKTQILLVDDHKIVRQGLRTLLESDERLTVIGEADNGREALDRLEHINPDLVIMDVAMRELNGIDATRQLLSSRPTLKILALSMHADRLYVSQMLQAGAAGYLLKECAYEELSKAIDTILDSKVYLSPEIAGVVVEDYLSVQAQSSESQARSPLTVREREVLQLVSEGKSTKVIARDLHVSSKTIESHRKRLMDKLHMHSIAELTKFAIRQGLTTL